MSITRFLGRPGAFRLYLAAMVVLSHLSSFEVGRPAVFVFFMLSGYWVMRMYDEKYAPNAPVHVFYLSRFLRIWLAFASAFVMVYLVYAIIGAAKPVEILSGLSLFGIATSKADVLGTSWSLDIEMQFYLLVPVLAVAASGLRKNSARLPALIAGTAALTCIGWYLQLSLGFWTVLSYLPSFAVGVLIWRLGISGSGRAAALGFAAFAAVGIVVALTPALRPLLLKDLVSPIHEDWFGMAWTSLLAPFVAWNVRQGSGPLDMHFGNYSYALYITHWPVIAIARPLLSPISSLDRLWLLGFIVLVSIVFYLAVDRSCERIRRRILRRAMTDRPHKASRSSGTDAVPDAGLAKRAKP